MQRFKILFLSGALLLAACQHAPRTKNAPQGTPQASITVDQTDSAPESKSIHLCGAMTKTGKSCRRRVKNEGDRCYLHRDADTPAGRRRVLYVLRGEGGSAVL